MIISAIKTVGGYRMDQKKGLFWSGQKKNAVVLLELPILDLILYCLELMDSVLGVKKVVKSLNKK